MSSNRRTFVRLVAVGFVALGVMVVPALAAELFGVLTKVDVEGKKVTVVEKGTDKEVEVTITDQTQLEARKGGARKVDLEKLSDQVKRIQEKGRPGMSVVVEHEDGKASKIRFAGKKKADANP